MIIKRTRKNLEELEEKVIKESHWCVKCFSLDLSYFPHLISILS
jgi:short-subunit dehydrogenase